MVIVDASHAEACQRLHVQGIAECWLTSLLALYDPQERHALECFKYALLNTINFSYISPWEVTGLQAHCNFQVLRCDPLLATCLTESLLAALICTAICNEAPTLGRSQLCRRRMLLRCAM